MRYLIVAAVLLTTAWSCARYDPVGNPTCSNGDWVMYDADGGGLHEHDDTWERTQYTEWFCVSGVEPSTGLVYPSVTP